MEPSAPYFVPRRVCACVVLAAAALLCPAAHADEQAGPYVGAALHRTAFDLERPTLLTPGFEGDDVGLKLVGGYRLLRRLAIEATYLDVADESDEASGGQPSAADIAALTVAAAGIWPLGNLDVYGKAGLSYWRTEVRHDQLPASRDRFVDPFAGVGIQYRVGRVALRADFDLLQLRVLERLGDSPGGGGWLETWSVGAVWHFR